jgi:hypothetical protein
MGFQKIKNKIASGLLASIAFTGVASADETQTIFPSRHVLNTYGDDVFRIPEWVGDDTRVILVARADFPFNGVSTDGIKQYAMDNAGIDLSGVERRQLNAIRDHINSGAMGAKSYDIEGTDGAISHVCLITAGGDMGDHTHDLVSIFSSIPNYFLRGDFGTVEEWRWAFMLHEISHCNHESKSHRFDFMGSIRSESLADHEMTQIINREIASGTGLFHTPEFTQYYRAARAISAVHKNGIGHTTNMALADGFDISIVHDDLQNHFSAAVRVKQTVANAVIEYLPRDTDTIEASFDRAWSMYANGTAPQLVRLDPDSIIHQPDMVRHDALTLSFQEFDDKYGDDHRELVRTFTSGYEDAMKVQTDRPEILAAYYQAMVDLETDDAYLQSMRDDYVFGMRTFFPSLAQMYTPQESSEKSLTP